MARKAAQPKLVWRKSKIVLTMRGRVIFSTYRNLSHVESFLSGWYDVENFKFEDRSPPRKLSTDAKFAALRAAL